MGGGGGERAEGKTGGGRERGVGDGGSGISGGRR